MLRPPERQVDARGSTTEPAIKGFWAGRELLIEVPSDAKGKPDFRAWRAVVIPRLRDCPTAELLDVWLANHQGPLASYEDALGSVAARYADLSREIDAARDRLGARR